MKKMTLTTCIIAAVGLFLMTGVVFSQQGTPVVTQGEEASSTTMAAGNKKGENVTVSLTDKFNETVQMQMQADQQVELSNLELVISGPDWQMPE